MLEKFFRLLKVVSIGSLFAFIIFELSLHLIDSFIIEKKYPPLTQDGKNLVYEPDAYRILCVGDSVTYGYISLERKETYPEYLSSILNKKLVNGKKVAVYNIGINSGNTYKIKNHIGRYLKKLKPHLVLLMAGNANYWNHDGLAQYVMKNSTRPSFKYNLLKNLHQLKTVKFFHYAYYSFGQDPSIILSSVRVKQDKEFQKCHHENSIKGPQEILKDHSFKFQQATSIVNPFGENFFKSSLKDSDEHSDILNKSPSPSPSKNVQDISKARQYLHETIQHFPHFPESYFYLAFLYAHFIKDYRQAILISSQGIKNNPYNECSTFNYVFMSKFIKERSNLSHANQKLLATFLYDLAEHQPEKYLTLVEPNRERIHNQWIESELQELIAIVQKSHAYPLIVLYPPPPPPYESFETPEPYPINWLLREVAQKNHLLTADLFSLFMDEWKNKGADYKNYYYHIKPNLDKDPILDMHPSADGNFRIATYLSKIIYQNFENKLISNNFK